MSYVPPAIGLEVWENRWLNRSTDMFQVEDIGAGEFGPPFVHANPRTMRPALIVYSLTALRLRIAGVRWHDDIDSTHCPTWSDGCRCDMGDEA